jgi:hypothetical protein
MVGYSKRPQIVDESLEAPSRAPAPGLLIDGFPGREVVGHPPQQPLVLTT